VRKIKKGTAQLFVGYVTIKNMRGILFNLTCLLATFIVLTVVFVTTMTQEHDTSPPVGELNREVFPNSLPKSKEKPYELITAYVTAYNTVVWQTDETPCIPASGNNICGRSDAVACPSDIRLGSTVIILDRTYVCEDRTHSRYGTRFDISFDKDIRGAKSFGIKKLTVKVFKK